MYTFGEFTTMSDEERDGRWREIAFTTRTLGDIFDELDEKMDAGLQSLK